MAQHSVPGAPPEESLGYQQGIQHSQGSVPGIKGPFRSSEEPDTTSGTRPVSSACWKRGAQVGGWPQGTQQPQDGVQVLMCPPNTPSLPGKLPSPRLRCERLLQPRLC